jgi:hypothetical protein
LQSASSFVFRYPETPTPVVAGGTSVFSQVHRTILARAIDEAETRTSGYYCIPPHGWQRLRYDLITRSDYEWEPLPESALARIQQLQQISMRRRERSDFFRIQLNDSSILSAARRENLESDLYSFFVYILTHEMVHMVRLGTILDDTEFPGTDVASEEDRVDRISRQILSASGSGTFYPVLDKFQKPCFRGGNGSSS